MTMTVKLPSEMEQALRQRNAFGKRGTHNQPTDQPRARRRRHSMKIRIANAGLLHDFGDQARQML